ncbi:hypothetical protein DITRI_Ditri05aG0054200 [Diplodiscus trichospermus]
MDAYISKFLGQAPLGNFEPDWLLFRADVLFSRASCDQQQVLSISDDGVPDLGGIGEEDTCSADEVCQPVIAYPGAYRKVSVELKIHNLAVDALLKSNQVNEMGGGTLLGFDQDTHSGNEQYGFDEATSSAAAFLVMKQLIQRCLADAVPPELCLLMQYCSIYISGFAGSFLHYFISLHSII